MPATVTVVTGEESNSNTTPADTVIMPVNDPNHTLLELLSSNEQVKFYPHVRVVIDREIDVGEVARVVSSFKTSSFTKSITFVVRAELGNLRVRLQEALA